MSMSYYLVDEERGVGFDCGDKRWFVEAVTAVVGKGWSIPFKINGLELREELRLHLPSDDPANYLNVILPRLEAWLGTTVEVTFVDDEQFWMWQGGEDDRWYVESGDFWGYRLGDSVLVADLEAAVAKLREIHGKTASGREVVLHRRTCNPETTLQIRSHVSKKFGGGRVAEAWKDGDKWRVHCESGIARDQLREACGID